MAEVEIVLSDSLPYAKMVSLKHRLLTVYVSRCALLRWTPFYWLLSDLDSL